MAERNSDRWISLIQSVLLHGAVVAALAYGWWTYRQHKTPPPAPNLAIEAAVVDSANPGKKPTSAPPKPEPPPPEPEPEPQEETGPPSPTPEEIQKKEQAEKEQEERKQAEEQRVALAKKEAEEKRQADEKAAAEKKQREEAEAKKAAEQKRIADQKRKVEEDRKAAEAKARQQQEDDLRRSLEQEEKLNQLSGAQNGWVNQIGARIQRAWLRPPSARPGIDCVVYVTQVPGGQVVNARVGECNGDPAVRESIESAVYRASPLPPPPDPALFVRDLIIRFRPVD